MDRQATNSCLAGQSQKATITGRSFLITQRNPFGTAMWGLRVRIAGDKAVRLNVTPHGEPTRDGPRQSPLKSEWFV